MIKKFAYCGFRVCWKVYKDRYKKKVAEEMNKYMTDKVVPILLTILSSLLAYSFIFSE